MYESVFGVLAPNTMFYIEYHQTSLSIAYILIDTLPNESGSAKNIFSASLVDLNIFIILCVFISICNTVFPIPLLSLVL